MQPRQERVVADVAHLDHAVVHSLNAMFFLRFCLQVLLYEAAQEALVRSGQARDDMLHLPSNVLVTCRLWFFIST